MKHQAAIRGFTLLEVLVVVAIMGMLTISMFPSIMNSLETRNLDNQARDIQTTLEQARYRAVNDKIHYRVRFGLVSGEWRIFLENQDAAGVWNRVDGFLTKAISRRFVVTLSLPTSQAVEFTPLGIVEGYDSTHNSLTLQSLRLKAKRQPDLRILRIFGGGTVSYVRSTSG
jgi:type II secretion system protein H